MTAILVDRPAEIAQRAERLGPWGLRRARWRLEARDAQLTPEGDWSVWLILAGRGWGKTRTGAEDIAHYAHMNPGSRIAVVAPTYADARDTCVEGESGLLAVLPRSVVTTWNRSLGELVLDNGSQVKLFSADEPERLRGPQHHRAWCDELAAWRYPEAWDQLLFGLRLGEHPQVVATTTPKPNALMRTLAARAGDDVVITRGSTFENAANLSAAALAQLQDRYGGTRLGRQELEGELLEDIEGALWTRAMIEAARVAVDDLPEMVRNVVAIDPAVTSGDDSDETGIIVAGLGADGHGYVFADRSLRASPEQWGRVAVDAHHEFSGDRIIGEANNGGDLVESVVRAVDRSVPYRKVNAAKSKRTRAEPVSALYEQGRVHHVGTGFAELEDQLCTWAGTPGEASPDRLDALVWALTELMLTPQRRVMRMPS